MTQMPAVADASSPVILHVPHASTVIPAEARAGIVADDDTVRSAVAHLTDHATDLIAEHALGVVVAAGFDAPSVYAAQVSRLVVDVERFADPALEVMAKQGMAAVYTRGPFGEPWRDETGQGHEAEAARLLERYYQPYHEGLTELVRATLADRGRCLIIDVHSYPTEVLPYELPRQGRPEVCIGTDEFHTPAEATATAVATFERRGYEVALNTPFAGALVPEEFYREDPRVSSVMVEIRRDQYLASEPGGTPRAASVEALGDAVAELVLGFLAG